MVVVAPGWSVLAAILHFVKGLLKTDLTVAECPLLFQHTVGTFLGLLDDVLVVPLVDFLDQDALDFLSELAILGLCTLW